MGKNPRIPSNGSGAGGVSGKTSVLMNGKEKLEFKVRVDESKPDITDAAETELFVEVQSYVVFFRGIRNKKSERSMGRGRD